MKKLFSIITVIAIIAVVIVACKDNFNESDFLKLQSQLKTQQDTAKLNQQLKQLNDAGALLSVTIQVVEDRTPLTGVDVTISNDVSSGTTKVTTDANGNAVFTKVRVGANTVILSKTGYAPATAVLDFGSVGATYFQTVVGANGTTNIVPLKQSRSAILPIYSNGGTGSFATITGKVTIENDLSTSALEVPQGLTILANLNNITPPTVGGIVVSYTFNQAGMGTGAVDNTTGVFTMKVPATAVGLPINLIVPNITGTKKMAVNGINGVNFAAPQYFNVPTVWGPTATGLATNIPAIPGAIAVFANPPAVGSGLDKAFVFSATGYPRTLQFGNQAFASQSTTFTTGNATYQFDRGTGNFSSSPIVTLSGGGASTQAVLKTQLTGTMSGFSAITAGSWYTGTITLTFQYTNGAGALVPIADYTFNNVTGGLPTTSTIDPSSPNYNLVSRVAYAGAAFNGALGVDNTVTFTTATDVQSFSVVSSGAGGTTSAGGTPVYSSSVGGIFVSNLGVGYTSAPTISAFTGGGSPVAQPVLKILDFGFQWPFTFNNANITSAYSVLPTNVQFNIANSNAYPISNTVSTSVTDQNGAATTLLNDLSISGTTVTLNDPSGGVLSLRTSLYSATAPAVVITDITPSPSKMTTLTISGLAATPAGAITAVGGITPGVGYNTIYGVTIQPTVVGAPGAGATVLLSGFTHNTSGAQVWNGTATITNQGSGYLQNLNMPQGGSPVAFSITQANPLTAQSGQTYTVNITYGTGTHQITVN